MSAAGQFWVSPHAVLRFQERIAPLPDNKALAAIIKALSDPDCIVKDQGDGKTVVIRTRKPNAVFRAFVVAPEKPGELPGVATILKGLSGRGSRNRARLIRAQAHHTSTESTL